MEDKETKQESNGSQSNGAVVRYDDWNNVNFMTNNGEIQVKVVDGEMRIYCDGKLKITPWASNTIRLSIE